MPDRQLGRKPVQPPERYVPVSEIERDLQVIVVHHLTVLHQDRSERRADNRIGVGIEAPQAVRHGIDLIRQRLEVAKVAQ